MATENQISSEMAMLKDLLEGATILEIKKSDAHESICELSVEKDKKKYSFTLFATDLGWWVSDVKNHDGSFRVFQELIEATFEHYNEHNDWEADSYESLDDPMKRQIGFKCKKCGKEFLSNITAVRTSEYADLLRTVEDRGKFAKILSGLYIGNKDDALRNLKELEEKGDENK